ncbi:hypothetical protein EUTSA_v10026027mg [Eutrema salsugineum]|uniref:PARP catalytic domain-containing protein n=1 Tax=Eutrema salsugineum TaxID=72664 RepID=V4MF60_EUTSA|nr:uncharacterized protein LOC18028333 [Eutrema salsugineum]ESQ55099.1 hypothetical protein EUTSA_v10026027mg [Eutrema salsugineum]
MPHGWIKSLQCKSKAFDDVSKPLLSSYSCRKSSHFVKDVIDTRMCKKNPKPDPNLRRLKSCRTESELNPPTRTRRSKSARKSDALTELPGGHPSRNVVEIIFQSSWSSDGFPGRIEMIFKVENGSRTVTRFEEYREVVKSRAGVNVERVGTCEEDARCLADGNEMMRFYPLPDGINDGAWVFSGGKGQAVCTFSCSGEAHASGGGGGGRRAMMICRVIAGRVASRVGFGSDSVTGRDGELYVFDTRAVLPCFLIIFRL